MGNVTTGNPLRFDNTTNASVTGTRLVQAIAWVGIASTDDIVADDEFQLTDASGNVIIEKRAAAAGDDLFITFPAPIPFSGLIVSALDGGVCYIYEV